MKRLPFAAVVLTAAIVSAKPVIVSYSTLLTDADNKPRALSSQTVHFRLLPDSTSSNAIWEDAFTVSTANGFVTVDLGSQTPLPAAVLDTAQALWLEMQVGSEGAFSRQKIATTFYSISANFADTAKHALNSDSLGSMEATAYALKADVPTVPGKIDSSTYSDSAAYATTVALGPGVVESANIKDSAVTSAKLANNAVSAAHLPASTSGDFEVTGTLSVDSVRFRSGKTRTVRISGLETASKAQKINKSIWNWLEGSYDVLVIPGGAQVNSGASADSLAIFIPFVPPHNSILKSITANVTDNVGGGPNVFVTLHPVDGSSNPINDYAAGNGASSSGNTGSAFDISWIANEQMVPGSASYSVMVVFEGVDNGNTAFHYVDLEFTIYEP